MPSQIPLPAPDPDSRDPGAMPACVAVLGPASAGLHSLPLRGRNVGILCNDPQRPEALLLQRAALELGARVALVKSDLDGASGHAALEQTARVLGRLYDAVLCVDLPTSIVRHLRDAAGILAIGSDWPAPQAMPPEAAKDVRALLLAQLASLCA